ncbi:MAG: protein phosphatase [Albidovulum sp.]
MEHLIHEVPAGGGRLALCRMPGRDGDYRADLNAVLRWAPAMVVSMATEPEMKSHGATTFGSDLAAAGIGWRHLPVDDFEADSAALRSGWAAVEAVALDLLRAGQGVLVHCKGGCGRSGMAVMGLMVAAGEEPDAALARLRTVRPCAVETDAQERWAACR